MSRALTLPAAFAPRASLLQQPPLRRPILRLVGGRNDWPQDARPHDGPALRLHPPQNAPGACDPLAQEDAERWDGLS